MNIEQDFYDVLQDYIDVPAAELDRGLPLDYAAAMSSFTYIQLIGALETRFSLRIPNEDLPELRSAGELLAYLQRRLTQ